MLWISSIVARTSSYVVKGCKVEDDTIVQGCSIQLGSPWQQAFHGDFETGRRLCGIDLLPLYNVVALDTEAVRHLIRGARYPSGSDDGRQCSISPRRIFLDVQETEDLQVLSAALHPAVDRFPQGSPLPADGGQHDQEREGGLDAAQGCVGV